MHLIDIEYLDPDTPQMRAMAFEKELRTSKRTEFNQHTKQTSHVCRIIHIREIISTILIYIQWKNRNRQSRKHEIATIPKLDARNWLVSRVVNRDRSCRLIEFICRFLLLLVFIQEFALVQVTGIKIALNEKTNPSELQRLFE